MRQETRLGLITVCIGILIVAVWLYQALLDIPPIESDMTNVLFFGPTASGKSSVMDSLLGESRTNEKKGPGAGTKEVYTKIDPTNSKIRYIDTPGLNDGDVEKPFQKFFAALRFPGKYKLIAVGGTEAGLFIYISIALMRIRNEYTYGMILNRLPVELKNCSVLYAEAFIQSRRTKSFKPPQSYLCLYDTQTQNGMQPLLFPPEQIAQIRALIDSIPAQSLVLRSDVRLKLFGDR